MAVYRLWQECPNHSGQVQQTWEPRQEDGSGAFMYFLTICVEI
jgi:hypothetical protein